MGSIISQQTDKRKPVKGGIFIKIAKTAFTNNEIVQGMLYINLEENFSGHLLMVCLNGQEETEYTYDMGIEETSTFRATGYNRFLSYSFPVYDFANNDGNSNFILKPGQWSIPFQFKISDSLPSSMKYFYDNDIKCSINYFIHAYIISTNPSYKPVEGMQQVLIAKQPNLLNQQEVTKHYFDYPKSFQICSCYGSIQLKGKINKGSFFPGETIIVQIECDFTKCTSFTPSINVELRGLLTMKPNEKGVFYQYLNVVKNIISVKSKKFIGSTTLQIPIQTTTSTNSNLIKVEYKVIATPVIDTLCSYNLKSLELDLQILPTIQSVQSLQQPNQFVPSAPTNWNPIQLQPQQASEQQALRQQQIQLQDLEGKQQSNLNGQEHPFISQQQPRMVNQS